MLVATTLALLLVAAGEPPAAQSVSCGFNSDLAQFRQAVGIEVVGDCLEDEATGENGDRRQRTTKGELVWRYSDGRGVFTNGYETWLDGLDGVAKRLNADRFPWERDDQQVVALSNPAQIDPNGVDTEGIALDPRDGSFWLCEEYGPSILRVVAVDVSAEPRTTAMYLYQTEPAGAVGAGHQDDVKVGDLVAVSSTRLLATERDSGSAASHRKVYLLDLASATDIKDMTFSRKPLEEMTDGDMSRARVTPVTKRMVVDLVGIGFRHELVEGLALVDDTTIAVVNDNNFDASEPSELMLIRPPGPIR